MKKECNGIGILGAPSAVGIRPYDSGELQCLWHGPKVLREFGIVRNLNAKDYGDVEPPEYSDYEHRTGSIRNIGQVKEYSFALGSKITQIINDSRYPVVLGGECSIVLGALIGSRLAVKQKVGLVYIDAHADFASPSNSTTGSAAGMALSLCVGRIKEAQSFYIDGMPLVNESNVLLIGRRDDEEADDLKETGILEVEGHHIGKAEFHDLVLEQLTGIEGGFWIHVDLDILDPREFPAVYIPTLGGMTMKELETLLHLLVFHPASLGIHFALYDPKFDPDRIYVKRLIAMITEALGPFSYSI